MTNNQDAEFNQLVHAWFNGDIDPNDFARLQNWLRSEPERMQQFLRAAHLHSQLPIAACSDAFSEKIISALPQASSVEKAATARASKQPKILAYLGVGIAASLTAISLGSLLWKNSAILIDLEGEVIVQRNGERIKAVERMELLDGDRIETGADGIASIVYTREPTEVALNSATAVELLPNQDRKYFSVEAGRARFNVAKQPSGKSMFIRTPNSRSDVLGTRLELDFSAGTTKLNVEEGRVLIHPTQAQLQEEYVDAFYSAKVDDSESKIEVSPIPCYLDELLQTGLMAHWKMNEGTGLVVNDSSGNNRHARGENISWRSGYQGSAIEFRRSAAAVHTDEITLPKEFTISLWVWLDSDGQGRQYLVGNVPNDENFDGFRLYINRWKGSDRELIVMTGASGELRFARSLKNAVDFEGWHHVVLSVVAPENRCVLYSNGVELTEVTTFLRDTRLTGPLIIGQQNATNKRELFGSIDDVRIYNRILSDQEIKALAVGARPVQ
jgi:ferric-dicitrate binding protein FerR (iron transport regulator)